MPTKKTETSERLSETHFIDVWEGDLRHLMNVVSLCRELEASARTEIEAEHLRTTASRTKQYFESRKFLSRENDLPIWEKANQDDLAERLEKHVLSMSTVEKAFNRKLSGDPDEVIQNIDPSDVRKIELSMGSTYWPDHYAFSLSFDRQDGCKLVVSGPTSDWVIRVSGKLKGALEKQRPWYRWLRLYRFSVPIFYIPIECFYIWLHLFEGTHGKNISDANLALFFVSSVLVAPAVAYWLTEGLKKILPAFELSAEGRPTRVALLIKLLGRIVAWATAALIIPLVILYLK